MNIRGPWQVYPHILATIWKWHRYLVLVVCVQHATNVAAVPFLEDRPGKALIWEFRDLGRALGLSIWEQTRLGLLASTHSKQLQFFKGMIGALSISGQTPTQAHPHLSDLQLAVLKGYRALSQSQRARLLRKLISIFLMAEYDGIKSQADKGEQKKALVSAITALDSGDPSLRSCDVYKKVLNLLLHWRLTPYGEEGQTCVPYSASFFDAVGLCEFDRMLTIVERARCQKNKHRMCL